MGDFMCYYTNNEKIYYQREHTKVFWDLPEQVVTDLCNWYNQANLYEDLMEYKHLLFNPHFAEDKRFKVSMEVNARMLDKIMADLLTLYNVWCFDAWDCPECGERVYKGVIDNNYDESSFQGNKNQDFGSYPGNYKKYTNQYNNALCDPCRGEL